MTVFPNNIFAFQPKNNKYWLFYTTGSRLPADWIPVSHKGSYGLTSLDGEDVTPVAPGLWAFSEELAAA